MTEMYGVFCFFSLWLTQTINILNGAVSVQGSAAAAAASSCGCAQSIIVPSYTGFNRSVQTSS